ncbi:MAG: NlpC/P60 family protein [Actinomycetota bacterium]|nr:NlpC/P60 family protein [Actinomycetota bacterium]
MAKPATDFRALKKRDYPASHGEAGRFHTSLSRVMCAILLSCVLALFVPARSAPAVPAGEDLASKSQQAAQVAREIDALDRELALVTEEYNQTKAEFDVISEQAEQTRKQLSDIKKDLKARRELLNQRARAMYKNGRISTFELLLQTENLVEFLEKVDYVARIARADTTLIEQIKANRDSVAQLESQLSQQELQKGTLLQQTTAKTQQIQSKLTQRQALLNSLNQDIQRLLAEEVAKQRASDEVLNQQAKELLTTTSPSGLAQTAMRYLGVPYHWAGEGPGKCPTGEHRICFDCSGLTMYVYKLHGYDLPHNAAAQFNRGIKIPLSQAKSGDLVFFGSPPYHCGMYLGGDLFVHAPGTGDVVKVSKLSARSDFTGVCRYTK